MKKLKKLLSILLSCLLMLCMSVGCDNYIGAAYLSTVSPYKVGAGFVALASERKVIDSVAKMLPEAVYLSRKEGLSSIENYTVCVLGCGLGLEKKSIEISKKKGKSVKRKVLHSFFVDFYLKVQRAEQGIFLSLLRTFLLFLAQLQRAF